MNTNKKTYGVRGIMEWYASINAGNAHMTVPFTGGSLTGYGVTPATFTTEHPLTQAVIENSDYYKTGKIFLLRETEGSGKYQSVDKNLETHFSGQPATSSEVIGISMNHDVQEPSPVDDDEDAAAPEGKAVIEVTDIDAAREYLSEEFGITMSSIRSKISISRAAEEHNIIFKGIDL